jgi:hypothetical protein
MKRGLMILFFAAVLAAFTPTVFCQEATSKDRETTRDQLSSVLEKVGPKINIDFRRTEKDPFSFKGYLKEGLTNAEAFEVLISVSEQQTIHFRIFPHYNGGYINIDKAKASTSLMRKLLEFSNHNFLYWELTHRPTSLPGTPSPWNRASRRQPSPLCFTASSRSIRLSAS